MAPVYDASLIGNWTITLVAKMLYYPRIDYPAVRLAYYNIEVKVVEVDKSEIPHVQNSTKTKRVESGVVYTPPVVAAPC